MPFNDEFTGVGGSYVVVDGRRLPADPQTGEPLLAPADETPVAPLSEQD